LLITNEIELHKRIDLGEFLKKAWLIFPIVYLSMSSIIYFLWQRNPSLSRENSLMENMQVAFLLLALFFVLARFLRERVWNLPFGFLLISFLTILLREVDLRPFFLPRFVIFLSTKGRDVALALGWSLFVYSFIRNFRASLIEFIVLTRKASGRYFILGCLFYGLAWPFDGGIFGLGKEANQFIEELLDNMGTFSFALSGFFFYKEGDIPSK